MTPEELKEIKHSVGNAVIPSVVVVRNLITELEDAWDRCDLVRDEAAQWSASHFNLHADWELKRDVLVTLCRVLHVEHYGNLEAAIVSLKQQVVAVERVVAAAKSLREFYSMLSPPFPDPLLDALFQAVDALRGAEAPDGLQR